MLKQNLIDNYLKENKSILNVFLTGSAIAFLIQSIGVALKYVTQVLLARWLGVDAYGDYALIFSWVEVFALLSGAGFTLSVLRFIPQYQSLEDFPKLFGILKLSQWFVLATGIFIAVVGLLIFNLFLPFQFESKLVVIGLLIIPILSLSLLRVEILRSFKNLINAYTPSLIIYPILFISMVGLLQLYKIELTSFLVLSSLLCALLITIIIQGILIRRQTKRLGHGLVGIHSVYQTKSWLIISAPLFLITVFSIIQNKIDILLIGFLLEPESVGLYMAVTKTALLVSFVFIATNAIVAPLISDLYTKKDFAQLQRLIKMTTSLTSFVALLAAVFLMIVGRHVLGLFGEEFVNGYSVLIILLLGQLINASAGPVGYLVSLTGFQNKAAFVVGVGLIVNVLLLLVLIPIYGTIGAAISAFTTLVFMNLGLSYIAKTNLGIKTFFYLIK